jgi:D-sedoheptulose 7-phosphate isomerase
MAQRLYRGGRLIAFGNGASSTDAQHIAVEFVHPVIMGKRALPAIALTNDSATLSSIATRYHWDGVFAYQLKYLARPEDIAIGFSLDDQCHNVCQGLQAAREIGMLTLALVGGDNSFIIRSMVVDHLIEVPSDDPFVVKEMHVTCYHILWELVHVFLGHPGLLETGGEG